MIQIYFIKRNFDTQKAERWFKERRAKVQMVDLTRARIGRRELETIARQVGLQALIDTEGTAWKECPARYAAGEAAILDALAEDARRLRLPIVREGRRATVGYAPDTWAQWLAE